MRIHNEYRLRKLLHMDHSTMRYIAVHADGSWKAFPYLPNQYSNTYRLGIFTTNDAIYFSINHLIDDAEEYGDDYNSWTDRVVRYLKYKAEEHFEHVNMQPAGDTI